jgi:UDP-N-acetylmuramyl pentapeptide synthase
MSQMTSDLETYSLDLSDQWRALVNTVMNIRVAWNVGILLGAQLAASQEGLSSMELVSGRKQTWLTEAASQDLRGGS